MFELVWFKYVGLVWFKPGSVRFRSWVFFFFLKKYDLLHHLISFEGNENEFYIPP